MELSIVSERELKSGEKMSLCFSIDKLEETPNKIWIESPLCRIDKVYMNMNNRTGLLSDMSSEELWKESVKNGSKQSFDDWSYTSRLIIARDPEAKTFTKPLISFVIELTNTSNSTIKPYLNVDADVLNVL